MYLFRLLRGAIVFSLLLLILSGCPGIEPYTPPNQREEGPESGLFSGPEGGFVIYRKGDKTTTESQDKITAGAKVTEPVSPQDNN